MSLFLGLGLVLAVGLALYLIIALLFPEKLS